MVAALKRKAGTSSLLRVGDALTADEDCCCPPIETWPDDICGYCDEGTVSKWYRVDIAGLNDEVCGDCEMLNGSYVIEITSHGDTECFGSLNITNVCDVTCGDRGNCHFFQIVLRINNLVLGRLSVTLRVNCTPSPGTAARDMIWRQAGPLNTNPVIPSDCRFEGVVLPYAATDSCPGGGGLSMCDGAGSTATVTAIAPP